VKDLPTGVELLRQVRLRLEAGYKLGGRVTSVGLSRARSDIWLLIAEIERLHKEIVSMKAQELAATAPKVET
jgi:hypothetical protein